LHGIANYRGRHKLVILLPLIGVFQTFHRGGNRIHTLTLGD
jgi:hypothetical protein